jgi:hypothetical protein
MSMKTKDEVNKSSSQAQSLALTDQGNQSNARNTKIEGTKLRSH